MRNRPLSCSIVALAIWGCESKPGESKDPGSTATVVETEPVSKEANPAPAFDEASFRLAMKPKGPYEAGEAGAVEVVLEPKAPYKTNDQYPYKFKASDTAGVRYAAPVVKGDALSLAKDRAVMTVAFTPESAGSKRIAGEFAFSVCTPERCLVERRVLALDVPVN